MPAPDPEREHWAAVAAHLVTLMQLQEWDTYTTLAQARCTEQLERLATIKSGFEYEQGVLEGMRRLLQLPHTLLAQARRR